MTIAGLGVELRPFLRIFKPWAQARTPVKNLFLTGADVMTPGIAGAMFSGLKTVGIALGRLGFFRVMREVSSTTGYAAHKWNSSTKSD